MNEQNNLENKILSKIKEEHIKPRSIWYFLIKDFSLWGLVLLSILLIALSIAPIIFIVQNLELGYVKHITNNVYLFLLFVIPYPWIILSILTTYFAKKAWEKTKHGYKFDGKSVITLSLLSSLGIALILNLWNVGKTIDDRARRDSFGYYKSFEERRNETWFDPDNGRLIGIVKDVSTTTFHFENEGKHYTKIVIYDETVPGNQFVGIGKSVRIIGYTDNDHFIACSIFPNRFNQPMLNPDNKEVLKDQIIERFKLHPECEEIFEKGRATFGPNFKPAIPPQPPTN